MKKISLKRALKLLNKQNYFLIDIRSPYLYNRKHLPNSYNIPYDALINTTIKYLNPNYHYLIICEQGNDSKEVVEKLSKLNFDVYHIKGGISKYRGPLASSIN